ncbi:proteasomal ATPase-associated factor 1 isoform X1 [Lepisosteus oculatus]|uniref:proteasomal ATPase-associated factor 1 isoform X1 n=2 Tax=Lepisosteus oculatus TaxID=7918 RepID=UPI003723512C
MEARIVLQSDWSEVLRENEGEVWVCCKITGKPTVYGTLKCQGVSYDGIPEVTASEEFEVLEVSKKSIHVTCPAGNTSSKFLAPHTTFAGIHDKSVTCLDISCGGGLGVSTSTDGTMKIWNCTNGDRRRDLIGHMYEVNCCRFFPSGMVVLSGGMDAQVKIWSCEDGTCPVTFKGHKGGILDTAIVDRGRNVISCSRDGTARLWDCGKSACLAVVADCGAPVNGCSVGTADNSINLGTPEQPTSDREIGTQDKLLLLAREDNKLQGVGLQSRQPVFTFDGADAFNCCTFLSCVSLVAGTQDGKIYKLDARCLRSPVQVIHRSGAPVHSLVPFREGFIVTQGDGSCFMIQQDLDHAIELTGPEADPVYKATSWGKSVFTCCRDGLVRKYQLSNL